MKFRGQLQILVGTALDLYILLFWLDCLHQWAIHMNMAGLSKVHLCTMIEHCLVTPLIEGSICLRLGYTLFLFCNQPWFFIISHIHSVRFLCISNQAGWSSIQKMKTPPASGSSELNFIAFGDMGKAPRDHSNGHYIQVKL